MVEVGDYLLYYGISGSGYTFNKYYEINAISGLNGEFINDDGKRRVFLTTKPNGYNWKCIKNYEIRKQKIEKLKDRICSTSVTK